MFLNSIIITQVLAGGMRTPRLAIPPTLLHLSLLLLKLVMELVTMVTSLVNQSSQDLSGGTLLFLYYSTLFHKAVITSDSNNLQIFS